MIKLNLLSNRSRTQHEKRVQAERLLRYLELLSRGGAFAVRQMVDLFGIRQEAVYRDIRRLGALGYPLETATVADRLVYRFPLQWHQNIRKVELTLQEIESALLAVEQYCRLGPPHRNVQLAIGKLQALHAELGPPARVRAWQSIVRGAGGIRTESRAGNAVTDALQKAISECKWCDLAYSPMGSRDSIPLKFAPRRFVEGTVFGASRDLNRWDVLNVGRISDVAVTNETNDSFADVDALLAETSDGREGLEIDRAERQVLRLVAIVRMLGAGKTAQPTELASAFATTLHTIRRDRELLEANGYSTIDGDSEWSMRFRRNPAVFGAIPPLPIAAGERLALVHVLERFAVYHSASDLVRSVILKLKEIADSVVMLSVSDAHAESVDKDVLWELVDAILRGLPCSVVYTGHRLAHRMIQFMPKEFQVGPVLRIKGEQHPSGEEVILIVEDIRSARVVKPGVGIKPSGKGREAVDSHAQR